MRNDAPRALKGNGFFSLRSISGYLRIVSSGASSVASTVKSAGAAVVSSLAEDDALRDQVHWAGFDRLECEANTLRQVLLLGYRSGFEIWDVEEADDVRKLASSRDGPVSFLQVQKKPIASKRCEDRFADVRPLLVIAYDRFASGGLNNYDEAIPPVNNGSIKEQGNGILVPTSIHFYSLKTNTFMHVLKFRSAIYSIRCSPRVVAVLQAAQIHCFDAATLEKEYTILTCPIISGSLGPGGMGYGPLAVSSRWLAYSGSPVAISNAGRVSPQRLHSASSLSSTQSNGNLVAHYAKESSKQLASGIVTLGDVGYKKLSKYCSEVLLQDGSNSLKQRNPSFKTSGTTNGHALETEIIGMVIVRDLVSKSVVVQFRAHKSPISALCFDPSGILLVTASIHGHNINIFCVMPSGRSSSGSDTGGSYSHLYKLQRGFTNAIIQDISFSDDSQNIMISSSRGTSHLFSLSPPGGTTGHSHNVNVANSGNRLSLTTRSPIWWPPGSGLSKHNQNNLFANGPPITLSVTSRIRNGSNGWKGAVSGAAAAATGKVNPLCSAIASTFHNCKGTGAFQDVDLLMPKYYLLVFSPSGCMIQYVLCHSNEVETDIDLPGLNLGFSKHSQDNSTGLVVEALQKWDVCHKQNRRDHGDDIDIYGENGCGDSRTYLSRGTKKGTTVHPIDSGTETKKLTAEEKHHLYISEVELHLHPLQVPLWARQDIYFQVMMDDSPGSYVSTSGGEIEIEQIPTHTIEARSKDLIPAIDYLQMPRFQQPRMGVTESQQNGSSGNQSSGLSEDVRSCSSVGCMSEGAMTESPSVVNQKDWVNHQASSKPVVDFVNNDDSINVNTQLEFVNNAAEGFTMKAHLEHVNNRETPKMETHFGDGDNKTD